MSSAGTIILHTNNPLESVDKCKLRTLINLYEGNVFQELICMNEMIENKNTYIFMKSMCLLYIQITLLKRGYS